MWPTLLVASTCRDLGLSFELNATPQSSLHRLLLEEANNLAFNLGQLGSLQREVIEGGARIAIQIAFVETLRPTGRMLGGLKVCLVT
jgi:hypothetical protein